MAQKQHTPEYSAQNIIKNRITPVFILRDKQWSYIQRLYLMSPRELEISQLVCRGLSNDQIAKNLTISSGTVKTHLQNVYRKIHVKNKLMMLIKFIDATNHLQTNPPA